MAGRAPISGAWGQETERIDGSAARVVGRRITVRLPAQVSVFVVQVFAAGADLDLGTADDVELTVRRAVLISDDREMVIELANLPPSGQPLRIEIQAGGETYTVTVQ